MPFLSVTITQPNDLQILAFACTSRPAHCLLLSQDVRHGGQSLSPSEGVQPKAHRHAPLPFGVSMGRTRSLQPAEAAPRCIGRSRITGAGGDREAPARSPMGLRNLLLTLLFHFLVLSSF